MPLEDDAQSFVQTASKSVLTSSVDMQAALSGGSGIKMANGVIFAVDQVLREAQAALIESTLKRLGPLAGAEKQILNLAFEVTAKHLGGDVTLDVKACSRELIDTLVQSGQAGHIITAANYLFSFVDDVQHINIGPVSALLSQAQWNSRQAPRELVKLQVDGKSGMSLEDNGMVFHMPHLCWKVSLCAAQQNVADDALWLIDMAISLLRVLHPSWHHPLHPNAIDVEPHPWMERPAADPYLIDSAKTYTFGMISAARYYTIDQSVVSTSKTLMFQRTAKLIFGPRIKSLAERVSQGLGWMTRARRAGSRAESFLFYFTAIEALLTDDDKSSPVTQTVSRHLAVIITNDSNERFRLAKKISALYATRSKLVHSGVRRVGQLDVNNLEHLTERLYRNVLINCDLDVDRVEFFAPLRQASFGSAWAPKTVPIS